MSQYRSIRGKRKYSVSDLTSVIDAAGRKTSLQANLDDIGLNNHNLITVDGLGNYTAGRWKSSSNGRSMWLEQDFGNHAISWSDTDDIFNRWSLGSSVGMVAPDGTFNINESVNNVWSNRYKISSGRHLINSAVDNGVDTFQLNGSLMGRQIRAQTSNNGGFVGMWGDTYNNRIFTRHGNLRLGHVDDEAQNNWREYLNIGLETSDMYKQNIGLGSNATYRIRYIPWRGVEPNGGQYNGYLLLAKAYTSGLVPDSHVSGKIVFNRGSTTTGARHETIEVISKTAYGAEYLNCTVLVGGFRYFQATVKVTHNGVVYHAIKTSVGGGNPDNGIYFVGDTNEDIVYVDSTLVSDETPFGNFNIIEIGHITINSTIWDGSSSFQTNGVISSRDGYRYLNLAGRSGGTGGASKIILGNSDSSGVSGPFVLTSANRTIAFGVGDSFSEIGGGTVTNWGYFQDRVFYAGVTASSDHDHGIAAVFGNDTPSGKRLSIRVDAAGDNSYNVNTVTGDQMLIAHNSDGLVVGLHDGAAIRFAGGFGSTKHRFSFGLGADNGIDAVQVTGGIGITEPIVRRGANRPIIFSNEESNYSLDTGATLTLYNFSGLVIINHWQTGAVSCWCVGGGSAVKIGDTGNTPITGVQSGNNYVFTSTYGATSTFSVTAIRTRLAA